jgi:hypothetical protein
MEMDSGTITLDLSVQPDALVVKPPGVLDVAAIVNPSSLIVGSGAASVAKPEEWRHT